MAEENICQEIRLKSIDETRNYLIQEINRNELTSKKHKKICTALDYIEHFFYLSSNNYWMCFNFCFCFFDWYSYKDYEFCNWIKNLCNKCRN